MHCASICQSTCRTTFLWTRHMADASNRGVIVVPCDVQPAEIASHSHKVLDSSTGGHATTRNGTDTTSVDRRRTVAADREWTCGEMTWTYCHFRDEVVCARLEAAASGVGLRSLEQREQREPLPQGSTTTDENEAQLPLRMGNRAPADRWYLGRDRRVVSRLYMTGYSQTNEVEGQSELRSSPSCPDTLFDRYRDLGVKSAPEGITIQLGDPLLFWQFVLLILCIKRYNQRIHDPLSFSMKDTPLSLPDGLQNQGRRKPKQWAMGGCFGSSRLSITEQRRPN